MQVKNKETKTSSIQGKYGTRRNTTKDKKETEALYTEDNMETGNRWENS